LQRVYLGLDEFRFYHSFDETFARWFQQNMEAELDYEEVDGEQLRMYLRQRMLQLGFG
jgi:hypothetical protein